MSVTVPLRLSDDIIARADSIISQRRGKPSRNSILREVIDIGLEVLEQKEKAYAAQQHVQVEPQQQPAREEKPKTANGNGSYVNPPRFVIPLG